MIILQYTCQLLLMFLIVTGMVYIYATSEKQKRNQERLLNVSLGNLLWLYYLFTDSGYMTS
jgi:hypothetical protein